MRAGRGAPAGPGTETRTVRPLAAVVVLVAGVVGVLRRRRRRRRVENTDDLRYRVPVGQDSAAVLATLRVAGFRATPETVAGDQRVVIICDPVADRQRVRALVGAAILDVDGHPAGAGSVSFLDE